MNKWAWIIIFVNTLGMAEELCSVIPIAWRNIRTSPGFSQNKTGEKLQAGKIFRYKKASVVSKDGLSWAELEGSKNWVAIDHFKSDCEGEKLAVPSTAPTIVIQTNDSKTNVTKSLTILEKIKSPKALVGKNTAESILSGIFHGYGAMSCGLIDMISKSLKGRPKVIVTGGYTELMKKFISKKIDKIDHDLVFKGLALLSNQF